MNKELNCNQVSALINFYIEGKLNPRLKKYVDLHLTKCPNCKKKIQDLTRILNNFKDLRKDITTDKNEELNKNFVRNLSAYIDNELNSNENIKIKKITISNPAARKELETMYKFKQLLHSSYEKTKNESKYDYAKDIMAKIQEFPDYTTTYFYKLACVFIAIIISIIGGFIYLYL